MKIIFNKLSKYKAVPICITIILIIGRVALAYIGKKKQLYLEYDYFYNVLNYLILIFAFLTFFKNKGIRWTYWSLLLVLFIFNTMGLYKSVKNVEFQRSFTQGKNYFMVRETKEEQGFSLVYEKRHKIFIYLVDKIIVKDGYKPFTRGDYKVIWPNDEKAIIKYTFGKDKKEKGDILNFTKLNGAYVNLLGSLEGKWNDKSKSNTFEFSGGHITYKIGRSSYFYDSSMAGELRIYFIWYKGYTNFVYN